MVEFVTIADVKAMLGVKDTRTIRARIKQGKLPPLEESKLSRNQGWVRAEWDAYFAAKGAAKAKVAL